MAVYRFKLALFISFLLCVNAFAQKHFDLNHPVALSTTSIRLDSLLKEISRQTGFIFSYNTRKINDGLRFSLSNKRYSVAESLTKIKEKTNLDYALADNHIILKTIRLQASPIKVPGAAITVNKKEKNSNEVNLKTAAVQNSSKIDSSKKEITKPIT